MTNSFRLVMTQGPQPGQTFTLDKDFISVGRDPGNDITINHPQISRQHARLMRQGGMLVLEDLGSTNGTFVNGMRLTSPHTLANGDVVGLGDSVTLTFYGQPSGAEETIVARPGMVPPPPPPPARPVAAPPRPPAPQTAPPPPPPPPFAAPPEKKSRKGVWLGCGCGTIVIILILIAVLWYMDAYYPNILYMPLRWLGY